MPVRTRTDQSPYLKRHLLLFCIGFALYLLLLTATFSLVTELMQQPTDWRSYLASLPGLVLSVFFVLLYLYMKNNDELVRDITIKSLAISCVTGLSTLVISMTRAAIGGYAEFDGAVVVVAMATAFLIAAIYLFWKHR